MIGDHLRKRRLDLGLLQKGVAKILGVDEATIWYWEKNRSSPRLHYIPKIIEFLGYVPFSNQAKTLGDRIVNYRRLLGLSQEELAKKLEIDPTTLARWEKNKNKPLSSLFKKLEFLFQAIE